MIPGAPINSAKREGVSLPWMQGASVTYRESSAPGVCCCPSNQTQTDCSAGILKILLSAPSLARSLHRRHLLKAVGQTYLHVQALLPEKEIL